MRFRVDAPPTSTDVRFRVLGGIELLGADRAVEPAGKRQRALLTALLLRPGQVVSADRLVEELWPEGLPSNPFAALHNQVARMRRALEVATPGGSALLARSPSGYRLTVPANASDAGRFEELVTRAHDERAAEAIDTLRSALALWRGPPFADGPAWHPEALRLQEEHDGAVELLGELLVETGSAADVVPLLEPFVAEHPLREGARISLMRALCGLGRPADALAAYREHRAALAEELGLEPSAAMSRLHEQVLRGELDSGRNRAAIEGDLATDRSGVATAVTLDGMRVRHLDGQVPVALASVGSGPPLVALPGWLSDLDEMASGRDPRSSVLQRLAAHFTVTTYDRRGTGRSRSASPDPSLAAAVAELHRVVAAARRPVTLLAMSQAGPVALGYADAHPDLVHRLVLFGTYADGPRTFSAPELAASLVAMLRSHYGLGASVLAGLYRPRASPDAAQHLARVIRSSATSEVAARYLEEIYRVDVSAVLPRIRVPALVLHYRGDRVIPVDGGLHLAEALPEAELALLDGSYHLPDARDLDAVVARIRDFARAS